MVSIRFGSSPEEQESARSLMEAIREGEQERREGKPSHYDKDGTPVYRILLCGLPWQKARAGRYMAADGARLWIVERDAEGWWAAWLEGDHSGTCHKTKRAACEQLEHRARRMPSC